MLRVCMPSEDDEAPVKGTSLCRKAVQLIKSDALDMFFVVAIILNSIVLGVDIEVSLRNGGDSGPVLFWISFSFLVLFLIEFVWRVLADGWRFFCTPWGLFDTVIIGASLVEYVGIFLGGTQSPLAAVSVMRIFRLLRLARIVRILHICPELSMLITGLGASMQAVFWVFTFLMVFLYICALICAMELGTLEDNEELRFYFGSVGASFYTHFMVLTLEGYPDVVKAAAQQTWLWYFYFVAFIVFSSMVLMNVVTGIVCESVVNAARDEELESHMYEEESKKFQEVLTEFLKNQNYDLNLEISKTEFKKIIQNTGVREALNTLDICLEIEDDELFQILDEDGNGKLSFDEFFQSLLRLRGSKETLHSLLVQGDLIKGGHKVMRHLDETERDLTMGSRMLCDTLRKRVSERIDEVRRAHEASVPAAGGGAGGAGAGGGGGGGGGSGRGRAKEKKEKADRHHARHSQVDRHRAARHRAVSSSAASGAEERREGEGEWGGDAESAARPAPGRQLRPEPLHLAPPPCEADEPAAQRVHLPFLAVGRMGGGGGGTISAAPLAVCSALPAERRGPAEELLGNVLLMPAESEEGQLGVIEWEGHLAYTLKDGQRGPGLLAMALTCEGPRGESPLSPDAARRLLEELLSSAALTNAGGAAAEAVEEPGELEPVLQGLLRRYGSIAGKDGAELTQKSTGFAEEKQAEAEAIDDEGPEVEKKHRRVMTLIDLAESSGAEARASLERIQAELAASRSRVQELEERLYKRQATTQTEDLSEEPPSPPPLPPPTVAPQAGASTAAAAEEGDEKMEEAGVGHPDPAAEVEAACAGVKATRAAEASPAASGGSYGASSMQDGDRAEDSDGPAVATGVVVPRDGGTDRTGGSHGPGAREATPSPPWSPSVRSSGGAAATGPAIELPASPAGAAEESPSRQRARTELRRRLEARLAAATATAAGQKHVAHSPPPLEPPPKRTAEQRRHLLNTVRRAHPPEQRSLAKAALHDSSSSSEGEGPPSGGAAS